MNTKRCSRCGEVKNLDVFGPRRGAPDGKNGQCKACKAELKRIRIAGNPDLAQRLREENRAYYKSGCEYVARHNQKRREKYWTDDVYRDEVKKSQRTRNARQWQDPEYRARWLEWHRQKYASDPEFALRCIERSNNSRARRRDDEEFDAFMERMEWEMEAERLREISEQGEPK